MNWVITLALQKVGTFKTKSSTDVDWDTLVDSITAGSPNKGKLFLSFTINLEDGAALSEEQLGKVREVVNPLGYEIEERINKDKTVFYSSVKYRKKSVCPF